MVEAGRVTLTGAADWQYQRQAATDGSPGVGKVIDLTTLAVRCRTELGGFAT